VDVDLIIRAIHGDRDAFTALVRVRHASMFRTAYLIVRDREIAADVVQDAMLAAWVDARAVRDPERFDAWLNRLLLRKSVTAAKRARRRAAVELDVDPPESIEPDATSRQVALRDEIEQGFEALTPDHRAVLVAHHYLQLSDAEAATLLDLAPGTYKSRLHRATTAMRAALEAAERAPRDHRASLSDNLA
jgi:RNA polymerase sigma-70 factor (ECF subfamily)